MAADLNVEPWSRLAKLCPPESDTPDLQAAADRYQTSGDFNAALADLWDEAANTLDVTSVSTTTEVQSISQDGVSVSYAAPTSDTYKQRSAYQRIALQFRKRSQVQTPLRIGPDAEDVYDPECEDPEIIIEIGNW